MSQCTAPVEGHRTSSGAANCPACRGSRSVYSSYQSYYPQAYYPSVGSNYNSSANTGTSSGQSRPRWSGYNSRATYTPSEIRALTPIRAAVEIRAAKRPDLRDVFLCHAWDDRRSSAKELHDLLESEGISVWFSEKDIALGQPFLREIDKGLAKSRTGIVLVTPALLKRIDDNGVSDKELSALLARDLLVPIVHNTTYDALRDISPLLGSRNGLDTANDSMEEIAIKIAELVSIEDESHT